MKNNLEQSPSDEIARNFGITYSKSCAETSSPEPLRTLQSKSRRLLFPIRQLFSEHKTINAKRTHILSPRPILADI